MLRFQPWSLCHYDFNTGVFPVVISIEECLMLRFQPRSLCHNDFSRGVFNVVISAVCTDVILAEDCQVHFTSANYCYMPQPLSLFTVVVSAEESKAHYVSADSYQVTWWPGDRPQDEINSDSTTDDHLLITSLRPNVTYTVVVEARKMEKYKDMDEAVCKCNQAVHSRVHFSVYCCV